MTSEPISNAERRSTPNHLAAVGYMLAAIVVFSFVPLVISRIGGPESPFLFNLGWRLGAALGCLVVLLTIYRSLFFGSCSRTIIVRHLLGWLMLGATFNSLDYAFFAWSIQLIDISVATVIYEIWPIGFILLMGWLFRKEGTYKKNIPALLPLLAVALTGFLFVVASQTEKRDVALLLSSDTVKGVILVLLAMLGGSLAACSFRWGRLLAEELRAKGIDKYSDPSLHFFGTVLGFTISSICGVALSGGIGIARGESIGIQDFFVILFGGVLFLTSGIMLLRKSNVATDNLGVNALSYITPIVALSWLVVFAEISVARGSYLVIGTIGIIIANLLINFQADIRFGFKALLLGLGLSGTIVYLRDGMFEFAGIQDWHWTTSGYFEATALAATVFTLLLAFRVARLVTRSNGEEARIFSVFRKLENLARKGLIDKEICDCVLKMDSSTNDRGLMNAYMQVRYYFESAKPSYGTDREMLNQSEADLDLLARSKQTGLVLGELFALFIFAGITIVLALSSRPPDINGWTRFLVDLFAMLISGVIIFLLSNVWDLHKERGESKLQQIANSQSYAVGFRDTDRRLPDQWLSVIVGSAVLITFAALLFEKWLP